MAFISVNEYLNRRAASYRLRIEVLMDDAVTWLDITDRVSYDRLASMPGLTRRQTRNAGAAEVSLSSLAMDNSDGFWARVPPTGISSWLRHKIRISVVAPPAPIALGVFLIEDVECASDSETATVSVVTLSKRLIDKKADRVKNGRDWWTNKSIGWLVRQLLLVEHTLAEVQSWTGIQARYQIPLVDPTQRAFSTYGRPPEFDGAVWRADGTTLYGSPYAVVNSPASLNYGVHWMGIGGDLWRYQPDLDVWTKWASMPAGRTNFKIMHVYINATRNKVICVAWELDIPPGTYPATTGNRSGAKNGDVAILFADMTTAPGTLNEFAGEPLNIWTGHYAVRAGRSSGGTTNIGAPGPTQLDANCAGINAPVPFSHYTRATWLTAWSAATPPHTKKKTGYAVKTDAADQGPDITAAGSWRLDLAGWYAPFNPIAADPMDFRWSLGQSRGAFAMQNAGDDFICTVVAWNGGLARYTFRIWKLNTNTGVWTDTTMSIMSGTEHYQPYSMVFRSDDAKLLTTACLFKETAWTSGAPVQAGTNEPYGSAVIEFNYPLVDSGAPVGRPTQTLIDLNTTVVSTSFPERFWVLWFDAIYGSNTDYVLCSGLDLRGIPTGSQYTAAVKRISTSAFGNILYSNGRLSGAVMDPAAGKFLIHDAGANQVYSMNSAGVSIATDFWVFEDSGFPPVSGDPSLLFGMVLDARRGMVWGVSGPGIGAQANAEVMADGPLSGKYYLWQFAGWLTDRIELADFSENDSEAMNVWAALEELAAMMDAVYDYDETGAFYFKARPGQAVATATLATDDREDVNRIPGCRVKMRTGARKVYNVCEMTPSIAVLKPPSGSVRVLARPVTWARPPWNISPELFQGNNRNLNVIMRCVQGGQPGSEDDGCIRKTTSGKTMVDFSPGGTERAHRLRFAFLMYDTMVETQLVAATVATVDTIQIPLDAAKDVRGTEVGIPDVPAYQQTDEVTISDSEAYTVRTRTDNLATGITTLRLDHAVPTLWPVGTKVQIRTRGNNRWSDHKDGVTYGNWVVTSGDAPGFERTFDCFSTRDLAVGMVIRVDEDGSEEMRITQIVDATHFKALRGCGGTPVTGHVGYVPIRAYWAPIVSPQFPEGTRFNIGGTGVSLRFADLPDTGEPPFMVGDGIDIVCPGLKLERQEKAKIVSYNYGSIQKLGGNKIPWPQSRTSRFAGYRQSVEIARRITTLYGDAHFDLVVEAPFRIIPKINQTFLVEDRKTLPSIDNATSPNGDNPPIARDTLRSVASVAEGVVVDPLGDKVTVELRAFNSHPW